MPEFEIYPSNLWRHKKQTKKYKQTKVIEQNSPMFALKLDFLDCSLASKENLQKNLQSSLKGKQIKKRSESFLYVL